MKSIFVGNLSFSTTEDELRRLFSGYGSLQRVSIMVDRDTQRSRGFAFVEMGADDEAEAAIAGLQGASLGGRKLNIHAARPRPPQGSVRERPSAAPRQDDYRGHARQPREPRW